MIKNFLLALKANEIMKCGYEIKDTILQHMPNNDWIGLRVPILYLTFPMKFNFYNINNVP